MATILVAVDHSSHAKEAFKTAIWLAKSTKASLLVLHAVPLPPPPEDIAPDTLTALEKSYARVGSTLLADYVWEAKTKHGMEVETALEIGSAADKILEVAKKRKVDLIVVGSRGMGKMKEMLLGSVSNAVVHNSSVPVVVSK
jgi:nucleotide-binding universal stress UspA family protein